MTVDIGLHFAYFVWVTMIWRFLIAIWQLIRPTLRLAVSTENYLATLISYRCTMRRNVHFAYVNCYIFANCPQTPTSTSNLAVFEKPMKRRFQRYLVHTEILSTFHARVEHVSVTKYAIETNGSMGTKHPINRPFPLSHVDPIPYINVCAHLTHHAKRQLDLFTHFRTTQQSPFWLQWDASNLPQNCPFPSTMTTTSNTPIHRQTPLTIPNGIRIHSAVLPRYTFRTERQTDRQTDRPTRHSHRPTDGLGDVVRNMIVYALIELERRANNAS